MNRTITISLLVGVLIFVMWFVVSFFLIPKLTEVKVMPDPSISPPKTGLIDSIAGFIAPKPREQDLNMALPTPIKPDEIGETVFVSVNAQGHVLYGKGKQLLDQDASVRDLPLLKAELEKAKQRAGDKKVLVTIHVDPDTAQQRVIDLLNALAVCAISSVTFTDLIE
jgi:biopolymer transport protein ExbD